jgi:16S rRNA processing protein RimM
VSESVRVLLGKINGLYGVRGWVKVFSYTKPITNILNYSPWQVYQQGQWRTLLAPEGQVHGKGIIVRIETCHDRQEAAGFLGADIAIYREQLPPLAEDEYYWSDLLGLTVINQENIILGQVDYLLETGANDVLVVKGQCQRLIPLVFNEIVLEVNLAQRWLRVAWDVDFLI